MKTSSPFEAISAYGVVPVIAIDTLDAALPLADALINGGLPVAEITFRTTAAAAVIKKLAAERPQLILGAGTVLTKENLLAAKECGAQFAVAPGFNPEIVLEAQSIGLPFAPGVATPSEVEQAMALGCFLQKFFPAGALGGVEMLKALSAPYGHTGVKFMPTGGVKTDNLGQYLSMATVAAVGGTWIATKDDLAQGNWASIENRCKEVVSLVNEFRNGTS